VGGSGERNRVEAGAMGIDPGRANKDSWSRSETKQFFGSHPLQQRAEANICAHPIQATCSLSNQVCAFLNFY
jgi:hypothetical protein